MLSSVFFFGLSPLWEIEVSFGYLHLGVDGEEEMVVFSSFGSHCVIVNAFISDWLDA